MRLLVGIPTVGRRELLGQTLRELAQQSRLPDRVVICSASAADVDKEALGALPFPTVVIVSPPGSSTQRNAILHESADADALVFFDDDFFPEATYLANAQALLAKYPKIVLATGKLLEDGIHGPGLSPTQARQRLATSPTRSCAGALLPYYGVYGCNMVVRMAPVHEHSIAFDEALPLYAWQEDIDFSRQLAPYGKIVQAEALTGVHLGAKRGRTSGVRFGYSQVANPIYLMRKGTMSMQFGTRTMAKNLLSNLGHVLWPEPHVDRLGRCKGNMLAISDLIMRRLDPKRILTLD